MLIALLWFMIIPISYAPTYQKCTDNTTLSIYRQQQICIESDCFNITKVENITCPYGCDLERNECIQPPYQRYLIVLGIVIFTIAVIIVFWRYVR